MYSNLIHASTSIALALLDISMLRVTTCQKTTLYRSMLQAIRFEFETGLNTLNSTPGNIVPLLLNILNRLDSAVQFGINGSVYANTDESTRVQSRLSLLRTFLSESACLPVHVSSQEIPPQHVPSDLENVAIRLSVGQSTSRWSWSLTFFVFRLLTMIWWRVQT